MAGNREALFRLVARSDLEKLAGGRARPGHSLEEPHALSPFAFLFEGRGYAALYHSLNLSVVYGDRRLATFFRRAREEPAQPLAAFGSLLGSARRHIADLAEEGFLVPAGVDAMAPLKALRRQRRFTGAHIGLLYLLVTNDCNLRCRYCNIESTKRKPGGFRYSNMPIETAKRGIDLFLDCMDGHAVEPTFIYYGGEPLLNVETFLESARHIRQRQREGRFRYLEPSITAVINGTLVTEDVAKQFRELGVGAAVSLDGLKHHHDRMRAYRGGGGSWEDAMRGYFLLKKHGGGGGISCTLGRHNWQDIEEIAEFFATRLECRGLGFNILKGHPPGNRLEVPAAGVTGQLIKAFEIFRRYGLYEDRVMRKVSSFAERRQWFYDCGGYGGQMALCADGTLGPCHIAADDGRFLWGHVDDRGLREKILEGELTRDWCRRSPLFHEQCETCEALAICGGGCADEAYMKKGDIHAMDEGFCEHCKVLLSWIIGETARSLREDGAWSLKRGVSAR